MPKFATSVEVTPSGLKIDGEPFPWITTNDEITAVTHAPGVTTVTLMIFTENFSTCFPPALSREGMRAVLASGVPS